MNLLHFLGEYSSTDDVESNVHNIFRMFRSDFSRLNLLYLWLGLENRLEVAR